MNKIPVHYITHFLCQIIFKTKWIDISDLHQTCGGWTGILRCNKTGQEYRLRLHPIEKKVEKPLMFSDVMGGEDGSN